MGVAEATFYRWKKHYGGLDVTEIRRLRQLEDKNRRLKQLLTELTLDKAMLHDVLRKALTPVRRRASAEYLQTGYGVSERRACRVLVSSRSAQHYQSVAARLRPRGVLTCLMGREGPHGAIRFGAPPPPARSRPPLDPPGTGPACTLPGQHGSGRRPGRGCWHGRP